MKKHVLLAAALCMTAVMATACGSKHTQTQETAAETQTGDTTAESESGKILVVYLFCKRYHKARGNSHCRCHRSRSV